jgi:transcriptional regulator with XRE-family HTH domain
MAARVVCRCGWTKVYKSREHAEFNARRHVCAKAARRADRAYRCARCGYEGRYEHATAVEARQFFDRHSCQKQERMMVKAALAEQREALIDRTPKPCLHKQADHQHGTRACYVLDRCRCEPCAKANRDAESERTRLKAYGRYNKYVSGEHVRAHIQTLRDAGMGLKTIAKRAGIGTGTMSKIVYGVYAPGTGGRNGKGDLIRPPSRRVLRETAEKLYAIDPTWSEGPLPLADGAVLCAEDSRRTHQRLQALVALGWSMSELGRRLGIHWATNAHPIIKGERRVTVETARKADALFEQLCMTLPPENHQRERIAAARSRNYAKARGWLPPLALDDLAEPTEDQWTPRHTQRHEDYQWLVGNGASHDEALRRIGWTPAAYEMAQRRGGAA